MWKYVAEEFTDRSQAEARVADLTEHQSLYHCNVYLTTNADCSKWYCSYLIWQES